jgi:ubiquinone/menaquinone biosynthesis C-methylase UbiE
MNTELKVRTSEELKTYWDEFEQLYSDHQENNTFSIYPIMTNLLKVKHLFRSSDDLNILELSVGTGEGLYYLTNTALLNNVTKKKINIYATDLSPKMLEGAFSKLSKINGIGLSYKDTKTELKEINVFLSEADNEKLPFEDNYFDIVFSNLSLQLVSHPDTMLKECLRVSKPNAWNSFSVWGKKDQSLVFTIFDSTLKKMGLYEETNGRSPFHLGQCDEELKKLVLSQGYSRVNLSHSFVPFSICESTDYDYIYSTPNFHTSFAHMSVDNLDKIDDLKKEINKEIAQVLDRNELMGLDALIILCRK